jgi:hypothetical protein
MTDLVAMDASRRMPGRAHFLAHLARSALLGGSLIFGALSIGALGYRETEGLGWLDATLNAAMILAGEGPVAPMRTVAGKLFAIIYALFSGIAFITAAGVLIAPALHRFLHRFHLEVAEPIDKASRA